MVLIKAGNWIAGDLHKLWDNFQEIEEKFKKDIAADEDKIEILVGCLRELHPRRYIGRCPAETARDLSACGGTVFEFKWKSELFDNQVMYIKFSLIGKGDKDPACVHSIHPDRPPKSEGK